MQIQISWPTDLDLHSLQRQGIFGFSRTRVKVAPHTKEYLELFFECLVPGSMVQFVTQAVTRLTADPEVPSSNSNMAV